jgi:4-amino-4-deoxy-L-arabinose transferase-like glycosyltransferase
MVDIVIIALIFLLSVFLLVRNFNYSVVVMFILSVLLHKELFSFYIWDLMPIRVFMAALVFAVLWKIFFNYIKPRKFKAFLDTLKDPVLIFMTVLWVIRAVSIVFTKNLSASLSLLAFFTTMVFLAYFFLDAFRNNQKALLSYLRLYLYIIFGLTIFGYIQLFIFEKYHILVASLWNIPGNIPRVGSLFWDVNHYGALLAAALPVVFVFFFIDKGVKQKAWDFVMLVSLSGGILLTNSRTSWIMSATAFIVFATLFLVRKIGIRGIGISLAVLALFSAPLIYWYNVANSPFREFVKHYLHYRLDSYDSHMLLLVGSYQVFEKYPILGGGYGSFFEQFSATQIAPTFFGKDPAALTTRVPAHTIWGELLAETGVLGLASFILLFGSILIMSIYAGLRTKNKDNVLLSMAMSGVLIGWLVAGIFYSYNSEFFWIIVLLYYAFALNTLLAEKLNVTEVICTVLRSSSFVVTAILVIAGFLIFVNLGSNHLIPWDEAIYAQVAKNMVRSGTYLIEYWVPAKVWFEKPPLYMWLMAGFMKLLGFTELAARLPSALLGLATVILTYIFGKKLFNKSVGFISALAIVTTVQFLYYARASMLDVSTTFFITLSLYLYYLFKTRAKTGFLLTILSGASLGLGVMTKGVVGLIPFPVIGLYELYLFFTKQQKLSRNVLVSYVLLFVSGFAVCAPWHLYMFAHFGDAFWKNYIGYHVIDRATTNIEDKGKPFFWYIEVLKVSMRLWFIALLGSIPVALFYIKKKDNRLVFLTIWLLFIFLFFSISTSKLVWYITPIYPVVALIIGFAGNLLISRFMTRFMPNDKGVVKFLILYLLAGVALTYLFLYRGMVYFPDTTGSEARLLELKDATFGTTPKVYIDSRMELPIALFYTDGPFDEINFNPSKPATIPQVGYDEKLILLTKKGRLIAQLPNYTYPATVVANDGDWVLWYEDSQQAVDLKQLQSLEDRQKELTTELPTLTDPSAISALKLELSNVSTEIAIFKKKVD